MKGRALLIAIAAAAIVGAIVTAVVGRAHEQERVKQWMLERDSMAAWQEVQDTKAASRDQEFTDSLTALVASRDTAEQLKQQIADLKAQRRPVKTIVLPDTGSVPVAIVKATQEMWQKELGKADEEILALERLNARQEKDLASYDRMLVTRTNELVAEHESRLKWEHQAKTAPIPKSTRLAALGELEVAAADSLNVTLRLGATAQVTKVLAVDGGVEKQMNGPTGVFVRGRLQIKVL